MANAFSSYSDNYLIDTDHGVIVDVEATRSIRQAEVGSTKTTLRRVKAKFDLHSERLIADTAYGTGPLQGWLVDRTIAPHIPVFDKAGRSDGTWSRIRHCRSDQWRDMAHLRMGCRERPIRLPGRSCTQAVPQ